MPKFLVSVRETVDRDYIVEAEDEDAVHELPGESFNDDTLIADYGGDMKIRHIEEVKNGATSE